MAKTNIFEEIYRRDHKKVPWGYSQPNKEIGYILGQLDLPRQAKVLDLGCGNGKNSLLLSRSGLQVFGLDISKKAISVARKR